MKKILVFVLAFLLNTTLLSCANGGRAYQTQKEDLHQSGLKQVSEAQKEKQNQTEPEQSRESDEQTVASLVKSFGSKLQLVSLQAPKDVVIKSMQENYENYVSQALITKWISNPLSAPGRLTSSPWPDRIEIISIERLSEYEYQVKGEVIEITSEEKVSGGIGAKRMATIRIKKIDSHWFIDDVVLGTYEGSNSIVYKNTQYGFSFSLPESWARYKIAKDKWEGLAIGSKQGENVVETGSIISIRHSQWTEQNPRQDIPIMIFTLAQWNMLQHGKFHIGAAPFGPSELGRNSQYVFALPARYNYAFLTGCEEVDDILKNDPLHPINIE